MLSCKWLSGNYNRQLIVCLLEIEMILCPQKQAKQVPRVECDSRFLFNE